MCDAYGYNFVDPFVKAATLAVVDGYSVMHCEFRKSKLERERKSFGFSEWVFCTVSQNFRPREVQTGHLKASSLCQDHRTVETYADFVDHGSSCSHEDQTCPVTPSPVVHYTAKRIKVWTTPPQLCEDFDYTPLKHREILWRTLWMLQGKLST